MPSISDMIKELRERTGAGMMDCKKALEESGNDIQKAIDYLREKGLSAAAKKAGRIAAEGICNVAVSKDGKTAVVVEVNCETDFAAAGDKFRAFVNDVTDQILNSSASDLDGLMKETWAKDPTLTVTEAVSTMIATVGENINIRRFSRLTKTTPGTFSTYIHGNGKIAVLLDITCDNLNDRVLECGKNVCLQIAALLPSFVSRDDISQDFLTRERAILSAAAFNENKENPSPKPDKVVENIINGRLNKYLKEICLVDQEYVKDPQITVQKYLEESAKEAGTPITIQQFVSFERGEGIEKKEENFAEEVAKATGSN